MAEISRYLEAVVALLDVIETFPDEETKTWLAKGAVKDLVDAFGEEILEDYGDYGEPDEK